MVFCCYDLLPEKQCSSDQEKLLKFKAGGQELAKFMRSLEQFIQTVKGHGLVCGHGTLAVGFAEQ